eukprot:TRINITY_DN2496_c0_g2_i1.p1 TRINITY_DN2496_c0_g2~~TRINITY_DN2496_c0_g2_i1.p1  ORF type:complete len:743 (+),score=152.35 TRINITY_DN2496_c0_g2_i1:33-2231(+)
MGLWGHGAALATVLLCLTGSAAADGNDDIPLTEEQCRNGTGVNSTLRNRIASCESECCEGGQECYCFDPVVWNASSSLITLENKSSLLELSTTAKFCDYGSCIFQIQAECFTHNITDPFYFYQAAKSFTQAVQKAEFGYYCSDSNPICSKPGGINSSGLGFVDCVAERQECIGIFPRSDGVSRCTEDCMRHNVQCSIDHNCTYQKLDVCTNALPFSALCRAECPPDNVLCNNIGPICSDIIDSEDPFTTAYLLIVIFSCVLLVCCIAALLMYIRMKRANEKLAGRNEPVAPPCKDATPVIKAALESGQWSKGKLLGRGQFGSVYMILLPNGKALAAKIINTGDCKEEEMVAYVKEITNMRELDHKNIVKYYYATYNAVQAEMTLFMEYVQGGSLGKLVRTMGTRLSEEQASVYMRQIVSGIGYLHSKGIIHRDIKGDNVLVDTNEGVCKISDFGSSKKLGTVAGATMAKTITGTPNWMAPEVITNAGKSEHSEKVDIWSIGATCVEILDQGKPPWPEFTTHWAAVYHIGKADSTPDIPGWMSYDCKDFVSLCLQRDPNLRPSCEQLGEHPFLRRGLEVESELSDDTSIRSVDSNVGKLITTQQHKKTRPSTTTDGATELRSPPVHLSMNTAQNSDPVSSLRTVQHSIPTTVGVGGTMQTVDSSFRSPDDNDLEAQNDVPKFTGNFKQEYDADDDVRFTANFQNTTMGPDTVNFTTLPPNPHKDNGNTEPFDA